MTAYTVILFGEAGDYCKNQKQENVWHIVVKSIKSLYGPFTFLNNTEES